LCIQNQYTPRKNHIGSEMLKFIYHTQTHTDSDSSTVMRQKIP
jgi:gamma-glutamylcysteine synthetase